MRVMLGIIFFGLIFLAAWGLVSLVSNIGKAISDWWYRR